MTSQDSGDEWVDLGDDSLSVISFSDSDFESSAAPPTRRKTGHVAPCARLASNNPGPVPSLSATARPADISHTGKAASVEREERKAVELMVRSIAARKPAEKKPKKDSPETTQSCDMPRPDAKRRHVERLANVQPDMADDVPPGYEVDLFRRAREAGILENMLRVASTKRRAARWFHGGLYDAGIEQLYRNLQACHSVLFETAEKCSRVRELQDQCHRLSAITFKLEPLISDYAELPPTKQRFLPIHPYLQYWLTGVRIDARALQEEMKRLVDTAWGYRGDLQEPVLKGSLEPSCRSAGIKAHWKALQGYEKNMAKFLPVLQDDYHIFQTKVHHLGPPQKHCTLGPSSSAPSPAEHVWGPEHVVHRSLLLRELRRESYALQDALHQALLAVECPAGPASVDFPTPPVPGELATARGLWYLHHRLRKLAAAVSCTLTEKFPKGPANPGSTSNGPVTYAEILAVAPADISAYTSGLHCVLFCASQAVVEQVWVNDAIFKGMSFNRKRRCEDAELRGPWLRYGRVEESKMVNMSYILDGLERLFMPRGA
ncbi:hypothetical protein B0T25DRAFT_521009 [Lasiosphaeria hispida]|uniref:Uncharacterized protein n=1 Tax=Lasiosphaeria hispida TaxID=260671 RepID=A0AAJ0HBT5_9PEZI|nr:hypothetical protein B0T25DRAFT_521009 [Lasiosphaeria hispida]